MICRQILVVASLIALGAIGGGCGGSGDDKPTERELLTQTRATLTKELEPVVNDFGSGTFQVPTGTCIIHVIATGADAPAYQGYPWTVESPDGEVAIKVGAEQGALQEDCNGAIEQAMGW